MGRMWHKFWLGDSINYTPLLDMLTNMPLIWGGGFGHLGDPLLLVRGNGVFSISKMVFSCNQIQWCVTK